MPSRKIQASTLALVSKNHHSSNRTQEALLYLYQPILGAAAVNFYLLLDSEGKRTLDNPLLHSEILSLLNISKGEFEKVSQLLEGIGLLRVYGKNTLAYGLVYLYELQNPATPSKFFENPLFSMLLAQKVGESRFLRLLERYKIETADKNGYFEVSKSFTEVFGVLPERVLSQAEKEAQQQTFETSTHDLPLEKSLFDLEFFTYELSRLNLTLKTSESNELLVLHQIYGLNELEMVKMIQESHLSLEEFVDLNKLKKHLEQALSQEKIEKVVVPTKNPDDEDRIKRQAVWELKYTTSEIQGLTWSLQYAPAQMLSRINQLRGTSAQNLENWVRNEAVSKSSLPNAQINLLMYYLLIEKKFASLDEKNIFSTNLRKLELAKCALVEDALDFLKETFETSEKEVKRKGSSYTKPKKRVEKIPEHMTEVGLVNKESKESQALLNKMMEQFKSN